MQLAAKQVSECVRAFPVLNRLLELGGKPTTPDGIFYMWFFPLLMIHMILLQ
jgi:hypothetical protein